MISANGWNWDKISLELPSRIKMEVQATPYVIAALGVRIGWPGLITSMESLI